MNRIEFSESLKLEDQREIFELLRKQMNKTSIGKCLRFRIVHCKGTLTTPERYRCWVYAHGYSDPEDGSSSPWLLELDWIAKRGNRWLTAYLIDIASHADNWEEND